MLASSRSIAQPGGGPPLRNVRSTTAVGPGRPRPSALPSRASWNTTRAPGETGGGPRAPASAQPPPLWVHAPPVPRAARLAVVAVDEHEVHRLAPGRRGVLAALDVPDHADVRAPPGGAAHRAAGGPGGRGGAGAQRVGMVPERVDQVQVGAGR